ncbi:MAG: hypothetical protein K0U41_07030 [Gammaproteobacteria bacterium]|nr:hypothetical protein [Gammaproteobacteria bacterium]
MAAVTIAFDRKVRGWTSEYSFLQDAGGSLNNNYYTWKDGLTWRHNSTDNGRRNTFYNEETVPTLLEFVFNAENSVVKQFKTISYEGRGRWVTTLATNIEDGQIGASEFVDKEGKFFAFIRGIDSRSAPTLNVADSSIGGIGIISSTEGSAGTGTHTVGVVPESLGVGDWVFTIAPGDNFSGTPAFAGVVGSTTQDSVTIAQDANLNMGNTAPRVGDMLIYAKDNTIEKSGIIGFYAIVTMTNISTEKAEIFAVSSEVFASSN